LAGGLTL